MPHPSVSVRTLLASLIALISALIAREVVAAQLVAANTNAALARDLSYLVVPAILATMALPVWHSAKTFFKEQFRRLDLNWSLIVTSIVIGVLLRVAWWSQLVAGIALGIYSDSSGSVTATPSFSFSCPSPLSLALGVLVMVGLVPIIEEMIHRGIVISALRRYGTSLAVVLSALLFAVLHRQSTWLFVFASGMVFAAMYIRVESLWPSTVAHATFNVIYLLDWRCLTGQWNPQSDSLPDLTTATVALLCLSLCLLGIYLCIRRLLPEHKRLR